MHGEYVAKARALDERHYGVAARQVLAGAPAGPVLRRLRDYPDVVGLAFGGYGEASPEVHSLCTEAVEVGAHRDWRALGCRSESEARSFLAARFRRTWGVVAARAAARLRLSRIRYVGLSRRQVEALRKQPRPAAVGRDPADVRLGGGVHAYDAVQGAMLREDGVFED